MLATTTALAVVLMATTPTLEEPALPPEPACESRALGEPFSGRLVCGRQLPAESDTFVTWDFPQQLIPNRPWRRWGTEKLVTTVTDIAADYRARFGDDEARLVVGDLSRTHGGSFGWRFGGSGHNSHQNGLDVDVYYPRSDGIELPPFRPRQIDRVRAQWLVNRAARADAKYVFIGPRTGLRRSRRAVRFLPSHHDNHLHLRIRP
jgi:murein endopeptidase